jgi:hypothetical protein
VADDFQKVSAGQPIEIPASTWNKVLESADQTTRRKLGVPSRESLDQNPLVPALRCLIKNDTGADLAEFSVVKLSTPPILPTGRTLEAQSRPLFSGTAPASSTDGIAILTEPIAAGSIGHGVVMGLVVCTVNVTDASHVWANPAASDTAKLASSVAGCAKILWRASTGTGSKLCIVLLGERQEVVYPV